MASDPSQRWKKLSRPISDIKAEYDVCIVGSGYGASIAASRFSRMQPKLSVCVMERGKEYLPGDFPDTLTEAGPEVQIHFPETTVGERNRLHTFYFNKDINVYCGTGLGGTSLINANVALEPDPRVFDAPQWPKEVQEDFHREKTHDGRISFRDCLDRCRAMLKPTPYPTTYPEVKKLKAMQKCANDIGEGSRFYRVPINVNFDVSGPNHVGVHQEPCINCGDCVGGCNFGAKNTLAMNYIPDARNHGAEIFTNCSVLSVELVSQEGEPERWKVSYDDLTDSRETFRQDPLCIYAKFVILGAGTMGSTEILHRSKEKGLSTSNRIGECFTGNGDFLSFAYNTDHEVNSMGLGECSNPNKIANVGPCITSVIDLRKADLPIESGYVIEDGTPPGVGVNNPLFGNMMATASLAVGHDTDDGLMDNLREAGRTFKSLLGAQVKGSALQNTLCFLMMSHDDFAGKLSLEDGRQNIRWAGVGGAPIFKDINKTLVDCTTALGGKFFPNPAWMTKYQNIITVHPLGGACMGQDASTGVVNHKGQVFRESSGTRAYSGLYVCDGSILPRSVGVNPLLTISAMAERIMFYVAEDRGWHFDPGHSSSPPSSDIEELPGNAKVPVGIVFTERMEGFCDQNQAPLIPYEKGFQQGKMRGQTCSFTLTVRCLNVDRWIEDPSYKSSAIGSVDCPMISKTPLTVAQGEVQLFVADPVDSSTKYMTYNLPLVSDSGRKYYFEGKKVVHRDGIIDAWSDTTTLFTSIYEQDSDGRADVSHYGECILRGILHIHPWDFAKQMTTMCPLNAPSKIAGLKAMSKFGLSFSGHIWSVYNPFRKSGLDTVKRKRKLLIAKPPEIHRVSLPTTARGSKSVYGLQLLHFPATDKAQKEPVILAHGLASSASIFSLDTVKCNLVEYLHANGYDVWCVNMRYSKDVACKLDHYNFDDIIANDWSAIFDEVETITKAKKMHVIGHCYGAVSFVSSVAMGGLSADRVASFISLSSALSFSEKPLNSHRMISLWKKATVDIHEPQPLEAKTDIAKRFTDVLSYEGCTNLEHNLGIMRATFRSIYEAHQINNETSASLQEVYQDAEPYELLPMAHWISNGKVANSAKQPVIDALSAPSFPTMFVSGDQDKVTT
eukprot:TRINITY_DN2657_c0_g1_i10.p1 TRINITY_DN2657_c0_g1~~TRINITY_DN2657_c0_g1_i10.p1  ORF type:complete len:1125 (+),score=195.46 TRINITY_DN2657_c0_g1_i10:65-3439(+)